jgi:hypothetical protein
MSFDFYLYRALPGLASLLDGEEDQAELLGSPHDVRDHISSLFPSLIWQELPDGSLAAHGTDDSVEPRELSIRSSQFGLEVVSAPPIKSGGKRYV